MRTRRWVRVEDDNGLKRAEEEYIQLWYGPRSGEGRDQSHSVSALFLIAKMHLKVET